MSYVTWKMDRYPFNSTSYTHSTTVVTLTDYHDPIVRMSIGAGRDTFEFKVTNFTHEWSNYFKNNDKITISRVLNSNSFASSNILMVGMISNLPTEESYNSNMVRVEGVNFSESIMSAIAIVHANGLTIPEVIRAALNVVAASNSTFAVTWSSTNPSTMSSGATFPSVTEKLFYRPIKDIIEKYSTNDKTTDGNYYWYVNNANELIWRKLSDNPLTTTSFDFDTDTFLKFKAGKDTSKVVNYVIVKGGHDPFNKPIQAYWADYPSIAKNGFKYYVLVTEKKLAENRTAEDCAKAGVDNMGSYNFSTPFTPTWIVTSYISKSTYQDAFREDIKKELKVEGKSYIDARKYGKFQATITFPAGQKAWGLGDLIKCSNIPNLDDGSVTIPVKNLRIKEIEYSTTTDTYVLEEDSGTI